MSTKHQYVAEQSDKYGIIFKVGFYRPSGEWVDAPHVEGWGDYGGFLRGSILGYPKENALEYVHWLNGGGRPRDFAFD